MSEISTLDKTKLKASAPQVPESLTLLEEPDPRVRALVNEMIGRVADKWTMLILNVLSKQGETRFTRLGEMVGDISQKMLTKTVRQMERDGLLTRTVYPVIPPKVEYKLTELGLNLNDAFCGVWMWAEQYHERVEEARKKYDECLGKD